MSSKTEETKCLTQNGISTTKENDCFRYQFYGTQVDWDYRDSSGELHTGCALSLEQAKQDAAKFGYQEAK